ncbi:MAG: hypothetical protein ABI175_00660 [Polyangiales bacterium]
MRWVVVIAVLCAARAASADDAADVAAVTKAVPACDATRAHCFGLRFHIARTDDGSMVVEPAWIAAQLAMANKQFEPLDTSFQLVGVDFLPVDAARIDDRPERNALANQVKGPAIDVFFTGYLVDVDKADAFAYGVTWRTKDERKYIIVSGMGRDRTLAHELGHFFGLPHSKFAISIMNKTARDDPPPEKRRFADEEIATMKPVLVKLVRTKVIAELEPAT